MKALKEYSFLISGIILFIIFTIPFINVLPYMDGNIDFVQTLDFHGGGLNQYFSNWITVHPPFKLLLIYPLYLITDINPVSYNLIGILFGILGLTSIYFLSKDLFGKISANLSVIFFSISPLFISNSIFSMRDVMITSLILTSLIFYRREKFIFYSVFSSLAVITKETALIIPLIAISIEFISLLKSRKLNLQIFFNYIFLFIPLAIYYIWKLILVSYGKNSWSEWIFADTKGKGAIYTIINNLITLEFLNPYAFQHWKQVIFLNFNWVFILFLFFGFSFYFVRFKKIKFHKNFMNIKTLSIIVLFVISYFLTVLSLQTYTIPRYALPVTPFLIIGLSKSLTIIKNRHALRATSIVIFTIMFISLFYSIDPVAKKIWGNINVFDRSMYALPNHLAGNDGITYNIEYLLIAKERSDMIKNAKGDAIISNDCRWVFPDPNNEIKMLKALGFNSSLYCIQVK